MRKTFASVPRFFLLSGLAVAITGCAGNGLRSTISVSEPISLNGELTTQSNVNINDGSRYERYGLSVNAGGAIRVQQSEALATRLTLLDAEGRLVAGPGLDSLTFVAPSAGTYTLGVSGSGATDYGPFTLSLSPIESRNAGSLAAGDSFAGQLLDSGNSYQLAVKEPAIYTVTMVSDAFDTHLALQGGGINAENDDSGEGTNSKLSLYLQPGTYQVRAKGLEDGSKGAYTLDVNRRNLPEGIKLTNSGTLHAGQNITGLVSMAPVTYSLELKQASRVQLEMRSDEIDSLLVLSGNGQEFTDDDSGGGSDAKLSALLLPGRYQVEAKSINDQPGIFQLSYRQMPASESRLTAVRPGQYAQGTHSQNRAGQATIVIPASGNYVIDLSSASFDAMLELRGQGVELQDDDSGGGTNARISHYLEAGEYRATVSSVDGGAGRFTLSVQAAD